MQHVREQAVTDEVISSFAGAPSRTLARGDEQPGPASARFRARGPAHRGGMAARHRLPHPSGPYHDGQAAGVHSAVRRARPVHADRRGQRAGHGRRHRIHRVRTVLRRGRARSPLGGDIARGAKGSPCFVSGTVRSADGTPLPGARIEVWEADEDGFYDVQYDDDRSAGRAWQRAGADGEYRFWSVLPAPYPIPYDGPVGDLLRAADRSPMRPAHLHYKVDAPGHRTLITHIFVAGDQVPGVRRGIRRQEQPDRRRHRTSRRNRA